MHDTQICCRCCWQVNRRQELHLVLVFRSVERLHKWHRPFKCSSALPRARDAEIRDRVVIDRAGSVRANPKANKNSSLMGLSGIALWNELSVQNV